MDDEATQLFRQHKPRGDCGKVRFDKKTAQSKKNYLEKLGKEKYLRIYPCPICIGQPWHLTKSRAKYDN